MATTLLSDFVAHDAWADAEAWHAILASPAPADPAIQRRLHHIHLVQHAFLAIVTGDKVHMTGPADFTTPDDLKAYARRGHEATVAYVQQAAPADLDRMMTIPWFKEPPIQVTVTQALLQAAMHSHYHRGQNATRLRELGGDPPPTDLIIWYWKGRPAPAW